MEEFDFNFLADALGGAFDDDHGAVWEMADALFRVAAGGGDFDGEGFAGEIFGAEGEAEVVDVEDVDTFGGGDFVEVEIVGTDEAFILLCEVDEAVVNRGAVEGVGEDGDVGEFDTFEFVDNVEAEAGAGALFAVFAVGEEL